MVRSRPAPGGGTVVEIEPERFVGWVNRFAARNDGLLSMEPDAGSVTLTAGNGTVAVAAVPFPPFVVGHREPLEAVLDHIAGLGTLAVLLVRSGAHSIGLVRDGLVLASSTDRPYVQGRTAAGGWSQQRYARRRGHQRSAGLQSAAENAARLFADHAGPLTGLVLGGDGPALDEVLAELTDDRRYAALKTLPRRMFGDIVEPRRVVLDEIAQRARAVEITIREPVSG